MRRVEGKDGESGYRELKKVWLSEGNAGAFVKVEAKPFRDNFGSRNQPRTESSDSSIFCQSWFQS